MTQRATDVAVIGAGTAGLAAERAARRAGAKTMLIDPSFDGTICARVGCMPSKLLIAAAHAAHAAGRAALFGVRAETITIDTAAVLTRVRRERDAFVAATLKSIGEIPAEVRVQASARFITPTSLALSTGDVISCRAIVVATGSRLHLPPAYHSIADWALTNETLFELAQLPKAVAVIGAGPLGLELAQALARLGVRTRLFDEKAALAGLHDREVSQQLRSVIECELPISLGVQVKISRRDQQLTVAWHGPEAGQESFDRVLVATGRPPNLAGLDLPATGIELDDTGIPVFDRHTLQCGRAAIFMAGDAAADRPVLHEASCEGAIAGGNEATYPHVSPGRRTTPFAVTFTDPPVAALGTPATPDSVIGHASYIDQGRARVEARNGGLVRIYADSAGKITGAALCAPGAEHLAHLIAWAIERGETARALLDLPIYHPTLEEGLKPALREICGKTDSRGNPLSDEGSPSGA